MADVSIDRYGINIGVDTDEILNQIDDTDLAQMIVDRGIVGEVLTIADSDSLTDSLLDNISDSRLVQAVADRSLEEEIVDVMGGGIIDLLGLEHYDTDALIEELRQRNALPGAIPKDIVDTLLKANQMIFEYTNGIFTPEKG